MDHTNVSHLSSSPLEENLSISQCKLITHPNISDSPVLLNTFGPKLSLLNRKSIDNNYKPQRSDSLETVKEHRASRVSLEVSSQHFDNKRSVSNSLNCTKNNLHIDTSDQNGSEDSSFREFVLNENKPELTKSASDIRNKKWERHLDNIYFNLFITLITIYVLFASDFQAACFQAKDDLIFDVLSFVMMGIFMLEMVLSFVIRKSYRFSFFFWLDLISTFSLLLDVTFIENALFFGF
jgi:hypothetical protein